MCWTVLSRDGNPICKCLPGLIPKPDTITGRTSIVFLKRLRIFLFILRLLLKTRFQYCLRTIKEINQIKLTVLQLPQHIVIFHNFLNFSKADRSFKDPVYELIYYSYNTFLR